MEETVNSVEDHLIDSLSFKLKPGASYVQSRRSVSFFPQGGNSYSSNGVKVIKISLTGSQGEWLDPSTLVVHYTVNNGETATTQPLLYFLSGPWCVFRRVRLIVGGVILEDIDNYNRVHELFHMLGSSNKRKNDNIMGFNNASIDDLYNLNNESSMSRYGFDYIGIKEHKSVLFTPLLGLINQDKYLPLRYMGGMTLEFELISDPTDCLMSTTYTSLATDAEGPFAAIGAKTVPDADKPPSKNWYLTDIQVKADVLTIDNNLNDEYVKYLLSGKALAINYNTYVSQFQTMLGQHKCVNITRSFTRLKSIF